jgi:hypothetical protein
MLWNVFQWKVYDTASWHTVCSQLVCPYGVWLRSVKHWCFA